MALIPPFFLDCVVSIGVPNPELVDGICWVGTGFMVGRLVSEMDEERKYTIWLVTNKHVLKGHREITLRCNLSEVESVIDYPVTLVEDGKERWVGHPQSEVDVAVFYINPDVLKKDNATFAFFELDRHVMQKSDMASEGVSEGDSVFVLGFPMGIVGPQQKYVIARMGSIARVRDVINNHGSSFLVDANVFPGNSGGPVVIRPELSAIDNTKSLCRAALIGIVKSYLSYKDVAVSQQTGRARVIFEENSGLAEVETVDSIIEAIERCYYSIVQPD